MLDIRQIESSYPENLRPFKKNLLREYLQYKILEIIFDSEFGDRLAFMGGTAARILYQNTRFSEDLDFDNLGTGQKEFKELISLISRKLRLEGYTIQSRNVFKGAYRCYLKVTNILFELGLSAHREEKLLIQIDTEPQKFSYEPDKLIINKFDVFLRINAVPLDILLAQKIHAIFKRKRAMGRDFYDAVFLFGKIKPNFDYLSSKLKIINMEELVSELSKKCKELNFKQLSKDVEPFLFNPKDAKKVLFFSDYIKSLG
ncbi:MAG: nucleotidyl transferase AbiEii/AbiGii toxin family protein [bacterium]